MTSSGNKVVKPTSPRLQDALTRCRVGGQCRVGGSGSGSGGSGAWLRGQCRVGGSVQGQGVRCMAGGANERKQGAEKRVPERLGKRDSDKSCLHMFTAAASTIAER